MRTKKTKSGFLSVLALFMALVMIMGGPVRAFAADTDTDWSEFAQDVEVITEEVDEDYSEEYYDDYTASPEDIQAMMDAAAEEENGDLEIEETGETELLSEDIETTSDELAIEDEVLSADDIDFESEDAPDKVLELLRSHNALSLDRLGVNSIPTTAYSVTRFADRISVKNNATGTEKADFLYAALIYADPEKQGKIYVLGTEIEPGETSNLTTVYDKNRNKALINEKEDYILWLGRPDYDVDSEEYYSFKLLGYEPTLDENYEQVIVDGEPQYSKVEMDEITLAVSAIQENPENAWADGYSGIKMKALIQKNLKSVKISWSPNTKDETQKAYKKYELYRLDADSTAPNGYKETPLMPLKSSKSYTCKNIDVEKDSLLYMLKCYNAAGEMVGSFVTAAAPYMLEMQSGNTTGYFDFTMTKRPDDSELYLLELASQKKEYDEKKAPGGFQEGWRTLYQLEDGFNDIYSVGDTGEYYVSKKLKTNAIELTYTIDAPVVAVGTSYYGRVSTVTYVNGLKVTSAPSNVLSCKAGPNKCYYITSAGVYYDAADAKKYNNMNAKRANEHINGYLNGEPISPQSEIYVHDTNTDVCAKDGLIYFEIYGDTTDIKSFELLSCNYENGKYKKLKNYPINSKALIKCTIDSDYMQGYTVYAMFYNKFTPEKDIYYAIRAISKTKSAPGGHGAGQDIKPVMDKVQGLVTANSGPDRIGLMWLADDCVKQYWIYRSKKSIGDADRTTVGQNEETLIAKVSISKAKKSTYEIGGDEDNRKTIKYISYTDKKNIEIDKPYYYYVRPVYNTAEAAKDSALYMDNCSGEVRGKASALYAKVKNFKAANEACEEIKLSFSQTKNIKQYRIYRRKVSSSVKKLTDDMKPNIAALYEEVYKDDYKTIEEFEDALQYQPEEKWIEIMSNAGWDHVYTITTDGKKTTTKTWKDEGVEVGGYYFYAIQSASPAEEDKKASSSIYFAYTGRVQNLPLPVTNVKASYNNNGIDITWEFNSKEKNKRNLSFMISVDGADYINRTTNSYTHSNPRRGTDHIYQIVVRYKDSSGTFYSSPVKIKYSLPAGIEVSKSDGNGSFSDNVFYIKKGESAKLSFRAYLNDGSTANYNVINCNVSNENKYIEVSSNGSNALSFTAKEKGSVNCYLSCAGINKTITIVVTDN